MTEGARVAAYGAGRMGRGIAIVFAYAGYAVDLIDAKERSREEAKAYGEEALSDIHATLSRMSAIGMMEADHVDLILGRISFRAYSVSKEALGQASVVFEGVPEVLAAKEEALRYTSQHMSSDAILASTTSTILSNDLQTFVSGPERFLNAHWLNPAYLVPLVELSPGDNTDAAVTGRLKTMLEGIGKVPVVCAASPGFIVPRLQTLVMNEAARMVEDGVASAEDIDKATLHGFGFRFAVLGVLEFIDWGGGDILYYASRYMRDAFDDDRFKAPDVIETNMKTGRIGLKTKEGFLDYSGMDVDAYQLGRQSAFVDLLNHLGLMRPPVLPAS